MRSQVLIGGVNYEEVQDGANGMNYYSNLVIDKWGLMMDDLNYNNQDMTGPHHAKIALIDSGNSSIQVPNLIFNNIKNEMQI